MPSSGLFALLDDIAVLMDDTAIMTKVAAKKTAGIVGDDLAVNAEAMVGINPQREIAIVARVARGSLINKAIIIPVALVLAAVAPALIPILLMAGGAFLCYEAWHKIAHSHDPEEEQHKRELIAAAHTSTDAALEVEEKKIKQAITTDFILSAEIIAIALGSAANASLAAQASTLVIIGLGMTVIVYGAVAGLVKLDDLGIYLMQRNAEGKPLHTIGKKLISCVPGIMKTLSVVGTAAMFLVGGSIILHGIPAAHHIVADAVGALPDVFALRGLAQMLADGLAGVMIGIVCEKLWSLASPKLLPLLGKLKKA